MLFRVINRIKVFCILFIIIIFCINVVYSNKLISLEDKYYYIDDNNERVSDKIVKINEKKYYFNSDGQMETKFLLEEYIDGNTYYFDETGAMISNIWLCISSSKVKNHYDNFKDVYWYYFLKNGKAVKAKEDNIKKIQIDGNKYLFNVYGQMLTGYINENGEMLTFENSENLFAEAVYYCGDDNDGVLKTGWHNYKYGYNLEDEDIDDYRYDLENIYLYFNKTSGKKVTGKQTINGSEYIFDEEGIMLSKWIPYELKMIDNISYYGDKNSGKKSKNEWIYEVPSYVLDQKAYNDEEKKYFYSSKSGELVKNKMRKIGNDYYAFNDKGIMQSGIVITNESNEYIATVDFDYALGEDFIKKGELATGEDTFFYIDGDGTASNDNAIYPKSGKVKLHSFDKSGKKLVGENTIHFSDIDISFRSNSTGNFNTKSYKRKFYVNGVLVKSYDENKYKIVAVKKNSIYKPQIDFFEYDINDNKYLVVTNSGKILKYSKKSYKDDNNYFLLNNENYLKGVWQKEIKEINGFNYIVRKNFSNEIANLSSDELLQYLAIHSLIDEQIFKSNAKTYTLIALKDKDNYSIKISNYSGYVYKSDFDNKKESFAPCGLKDIQGKTIDAMNWNNSDYKTVMDDSFFSNCYWN